MNELMERMQNLLDEARRQGIAEAAQALRDWRSDNFDEDSSDADYLNGIDDAILTVEKL